MSEFVEHQLGEFFRVKHGYAFKSAFFAKEGDFIVLTPGNFKEEGGLKSQGEKEKFYSADPPSDFILRAGDLLTVMTDLTQEARILGASAFVRQDGRFLHNQRLGKIVDLDINRLDKNYLYHLFNWSHVRDQLKGSATGSTVRHTAPDRIYAVTVPLPPLPTQERIAAILSAYDDLIENNTRRIAILEEMARRLYEEWFVHFRFPGHEAAEFDGEFPKGWSEVPLGEVANVTWGDTKTTKKSYVDTGYVAYSAAGPDGFLPHFDYERTGIVLSAIGAKCGITWFARGKWSCIKNTIRLFSSDQSVSDEYLFFATGYSDYWPKRGAAQPFISQGDAKNCRVVVPHRELHERFLSLARPALEQADGLRLTNANLRAQRDLLLPKLVSGEIDVSNQEETAMEAAE